MKSETLFKYAVRFYIGFFFLYLFTPLIVMGLATFNDSRFPTVSPWRGFTLKWFEALAQDGGMWAALLNSVIVAAGVLIVAVPIGVCCALFLSTVQGKGKTFIYSLMMSPLLTPGVIVGISTLIFWKGLSVSGGIVLTVIAQTTFIAAYVMLMVLARLQRFDRTLENAALSLGATQWQAFRRILLPYLKPAIFSAAAIAFLQSFENYNTTLFVKGYDTTLTVYIASKVRTGLTPAVNALGLVMILLTVVLAVVYEIKRRREAEARNRA
ncbi:ABC transporter permease [Marinomonas mediterranea]|jgi:ABC-type spermidine/putrescine transport system, permease component II|uniref:ABC-type transporter, integral membrane subunit n=1 Tax=Marinomonas mediterranea (strain ATCC 700492 / JCM 21426 / NBRC 103028 / MMB-1) TaxID=717774 RepID=F2JZC3_MARM1|nr:ABC transporter permease [Marinomonas mediterranea]ADZ93208.1 ABC-type transporter, integral membrane subunit [Marinomonas mediterranea MMB-1]WCN11098.1 ABC transporter permease subunit [Marinomonas mediterranea]WCN15161.1 ABC transporter permease subunit [Marinomonas mediterranea]WCN19205.1 ABC transporter permease subunit [Marinomonas mediterranea MMB-1]